MFKYEFVRQAFLIGGLLAVIIPLIGVVVVFRRMSMIGDALSHVSLSGIILGVILGINPILGAICISLVAAISIDYIQRKLGKYEEMAIAIIMSFGIGLSGVLMGFVNSPGNFNRFLFGSIVSISKHDTLLAIVLSGLVIVMSIVCRREFAFIAFDERSAHLSGINTERTRLLFTVLTAITVSIASRIVGALIVSSLMVIPVAAAMQISRSYKQTIVFSIIFSLIAVWCGLFISYFADIAPGGTIVLFAILLLMIVLILKSLKKH